MKLKALKKHSRAGEKIKLVAVAASEQERRIQEAVARRAYEICESRGSAAWHELEDWRQAESELLHPRCSSQMKVDGALWVGTDAALFEEGTIEIWVAPLRLTISGKPRVANARADTQSSGSCRCGGLIFQMIDLTCEVDPSRVTAKIDGPSLEILLRTAHAEPDAKQKVQAAAA